MNRIILLTLLIFHVCLSQEPIKEIVILEPHASPFSKRVEFHTENLIVDYLKQASSEDIQVVLNALLASYQYALIDLKYEKLLAKIIVTLWNIKTQKKDDDLSTFIELSKKFLEVSRQKTEITAIWQAVTKYLQANEQCNAELIFTEIAQERVKIVQEYLKNNEEIFFHSCAQAHEDNQKIAQRIYNTANVLKAMHEMPYSGDQDERAFAALNMAFSLLLRLEQEQPILIQALKPLQNHIEDIVLINSMLDSLYYAACYGFLEKHHASDNAMILFNQDGFIPKDKRIAYLPSVVYCNEGY